MRKVIYVCMIFALISFSSRAQGVLGKWHSIDPDTGAKESVIQVYKEGNKLYGKIIEILNEEDKDKTCTECTGKDKNVPIQGLVIVRGLSEEGDEWTGGKVLDPKNGKLYKCYISLESEDKLKLRGYIGFSLIGRTEYWYRVKSDE
ncbi:DUF2147 domain-containing protein [Lutimonas saemankumensis]|uniref:DUF2147 domain-containing protein n=1 Tax=Lutimonas saemankumensis TaxID=483016 RepID=UPI001CD2D323|nr:DUF2147 domain-containing protein [Lutimonas saemankumensis]MCA0931514.1 DUF2147 domain-containing protein [Lutimonas saemankumensis]